MDLKNQNHGAGDAVVPERICIDSNFVNSPALSDAQEVSLRSYQTDIIAEFEQLVEQGLRSILMVAPTGSGKTVIASAIIKGWPRRVLVVAHRREIVNQTSAKLAAFGV